MAGSAMSSATAAATAAKPEASADSLAHAAAAAAVGRTFDGARQEEPNYRGCVCRAWTNGNDRGIGPCDIPSPPSLHLPSLFPAPPSSLFPAPPRG